MKRILIIEDEELVRFTLGKMLAGEEFELVEAEDGRAGIEKMTAQPVDLVITDIVMPRQEGIETIRLLKQRWPDVPVIAVSGGGRAGNSSYLGAAEALGADAALAKPFSRDELLLAIKRLLPKGSVS